MNNTFICEKCGNTTFEQITYKQARCLQCGYLNWHDSEIKDKRKPEFIVEDNIIIPESKTVYVSAPMIKRFVNRMIDLMTLSFIVAIVTSIFTKIDMSNYEAIINNLSFRIILLGAIITYYTILEFLFGKTLGKLITKTSVVSTNNSKLSLYQCFLRSLIRDIIPFEFITGFFLKGNFLHDILPKTMVVED